MELTLETRSFLAGENRGLGWHAIPENCPANVRESLIEWRCMNIISKPTAPRKAAVITAVTTETKREQMRKRLALTSL
jgi:hypothetical protein